MKGFVDSLWRHFPKEESFIKSVPDGYNNTLMRHIMVSYSLGFVNWYKSGMWGFNLDSRLGLQVCSFEDSEFLENLVKNADTRDKGEITIYRISSAGVPYQDRATLYDIRDKMTKQAQERGFTIGRGCGKIPAS
jgi:hypothetical protein